MLPKEIDPRNGKEEIIDNVTAHKKRIYEVLFELKKSSKSEIGRDLIFGFHK